MREMRFPKMSLTRLPTRDPCKRNGQAGGGSRGTGGMRGSSLLPREGRSTRANPGRNPARAQRAERQRAAGSLQLLSSLQTHEHYPSAWRPASQRCWGPLHPPYTQHEASRDARQAGQLLVLMRGSDYGPSRSSRLRRGTMHLGCEQL